MLQLAPTPAQLIVPALATPQVAYVCLSINTSATAVRSNGLAWAFVVDASHSMRIPIVSDEIFRQLARTGNVHEVLVDGVPVWQFSGPVPDYVRETSPSALSYVGDALQSIVEHLRAQDQFALVACAEQAVLLVPLQPGRNREKLLEQLARLHDVALGDATDLAVGLRLIMDHLHQFAPAHTYTRRIVLLTDGFTRNADACLTLARAAAQQQIAMSTLGLGGDFQEDLLTTLADSTGGRAVMLSDADQIAAAVAAEFAAAHHTQSLSLDLHLSRGVAVRHATRLLPDLALLAAQPASDERSLTLRLGDPDEQGRLDLLLELIVPATPRPTDAVSRRVRLAQVMVQSGTQQVTLDLVATYAATAVPLEPQVQQAVARASTARLLQRGLGLAQQGDAATASGVLANVASRLQAAGETELAAAVQREADTLSQTGQTTRLGPKELAYATRRLGKRSS